MKSKILPLHIPELQFVPEVTHSLGILSGHPSYMEWILDNYLDISINRDYEKINLEDIDRSPDCPLVEEFHVKRHFAEHIADGLLQFLIRCIDSGYYVSLTVDVFFLGCYRPAGGISTHFEHKVLVFGYEQDGQLFHIADFFDFLHYSMAVCPCGELELSFFHLFTFREKSPLYQYNPVLYEKSMQNISLQRLLTDNSYHCGVEAFCRNLSNYLNPAYPEKASKCGRRTESNVFNLHFYDVLSAYAAQRSDDGEPLYHRPFAMLVQHKELMGTRLLYLKSQYGIVSKELSEAQEALNGLLNQCRTMLTTALFYNRSRRRNAAAAVSRALLEVKEKERLTMELLVRALSHDIK